MKIILFTLLLSSLYAQNSTFGTSWSKSKASDSAVTTMDDLSDYVAVSPKSKLDSLEESLEFMQSQYITMMVKMNELILDNRKLNIRVKSIEDFLIELQTTKKSKSGK